jgi:hypothetical protein
MISFPGYRPQREGTADLLKGIAVIFMIQVHIMEQFVAPDIYGSFIGKVSLFLGGPFCAPVFMAVMGYFLACSKRPFFYSIKRGIFLFLGGILLNTLRSTHLLILIGTGEKNLDPWAYIFGADILTLAGLSMILTGILRLLFRENSWLYIVTTLSIAALSPWIGRHLPSTGTFGFVVAFLWGTLPWSYFPVFPWLSYVLAGYVFSLLVRQNKVFQKIDLKKQYVYFIPGWIFIFLSLPYASGITGHLDGPEGYYHHGIVFFLWILLFMISYTVLIRLAEIYYHETSFLGIVKWIGQKVTLIYVIQWIIIGNIAPLIYKSQGLFMFPGWFIIVSVATFIIAYVFECAKDSLRKRKNENVELGSK